MNRDMDWLRPLALALAALTAGLFSLAVSRAQSGDEIVNSLGMKFVLIPRGSFKMGSAESEQYRRDDETAHMVQIARPFYMAAYEVTQRQFEQVMGVNPSFFSAAGPGKGSVRPKEAPVHPVESVTWNQAAEFCVKLSARDGEKTRKFTYRLPTEAEWEWACRAGTSTPLFFGHDISSHDANFNGIAPLGNGRMGPFLRATTSTGGYRSNAFGLYDMHGNVAEWCSDGYAIDYYRKSPKVNPQGPSEANEKIIRGGGWTNTARECRSAARNHFPADFSSPNIGFRVVLIEPD